MTLIERIQLLKEDLQSDFFACLIEMQEVLKGLDTEKQFDILAVTVQIGYKSIITHHNKNKIPKEVVKQALNQGRHEPKEFLKLWQKGELENHFDGLPKP